MPGRAMFIYTVQGKKYILVPIVTKSKVGLVLRGCHIYSAHQTPVGYWYLENMPIKLIREIHRWAKENQLDGVIDWQDNAPMFKERLHS